MYYLHQLETVISTFCDTFSRIPPPLAACTLMCLGVIHVVSKHTHDRWQTALSKTLWGSNNTHTHTQISWYLTHSLEISHLGCSLSPNPSFLPQLFLGISSQSAMYKRMYKLCLFMHTLGSQNLSITGKEMHLQSLYRI